MVILFAMEKLNSVFGKDSLTPYIYILTYIHP